MRKEAEALTPAQGFPIEGGLISLPPVFRDRAGDRVVKAGVQCPEVLCGNRNVHVHCHLRDGLTHVTIVVNNLRHGESLTQEVMPVPDRDAADLEVRRESEP